MNNKIKHTFNAEPAWNKLLCRLEQDGLLTEQQPSQHERNLFPTVVKWAAAILFIGCSLAIWMHRNNADPVAVNAPQMTIHNDNVIALVKTLEDGSIIYLEDNATLSYPEQFLSGRRDVSLTGNAFFDVTGNTERPFRIDTEEFTIEVLGTCFHIAGSDLDAFRLSVQQGTVKVTSKLNGENRLVKEGESVFLDASGHLQLESNNDETVFRFITRNIRFKDETVSNILHVINKNNSGYRIEVDSSLANRKLTLGFEDNPPDYIVSLISLALNSSFSKMDNVYYISD